MNHASETERPAAVHDPDLEALLERAGHDLDTGELAVALHRAEEDSARAARREGGHWVWALLAAGALLAAVLADGWLAVAAVLLGLLYTLPILLAGASTARRETARHVLEDALHDHEARVERQAPRDAGEA